MFRPLNNQRPVLVTPLSACVKWPNAEIKSRA
jgi:hypothetical protein